MTIKIINNRDQEIYENTSLCVDYVDSWAGGVLRELGIFIKKVDRNPDIITIYAE